MEAQTQPVRFIDLALFSDLASQLEDTRAPGSARLQFLGHLILLAWPSLGGVLATLSWGVWQIITLVKAPGLARAREGDLATARPRPDGGRLQRHNANDLS